MWFCFWKTALNYGWSKPWGKCRLAENLIKLTWYENFSWKYYTNYADFFIFSVVQETRMQRNRYSGKQNDKLIISPIYSMASLFNWFILNSQFLNVIHCFLKFIQCQYKSNFNWGPLILDKFCQIQRTFFNENG